MTPPLQKNRPTEPSISPAELKWDKNVPLSSHHQDFYFSLANGLEESRYVFLEANQLASRLTRDLHKSAPFTIAETGFGTGLNFLTTYQLWCSLKPPKRSLHYISVEKHPLTKEDLSECLSSWPELASISKLLVEAYPELIAGQHHLDFELGEIRLTLLFSDALYAFNNYSFICDCWFLDGFSPNKNPSMWSDTLFKSVALHSYRQTTISTFTSASSVQKGLKNAGFEVSKPPGFGKKREMLVGSFSQSPEFSKRSKARWSINRHESGQEETHLKPKVNTQASEHTYDVIVLGAGLAGVTTARTLAQEGLRVAVIEQNNDPVSGASGQAQLAMYAKLPSEANKISRFTAHCLMHSQRHYSKHQFCANNVEFWNQSGLLQLAWNSKEKDKQARFIQNFSFPVSFIQHVDAKKCSDHSGLELPYSGLWFPKCGWLDPVQYSKYILDHELIETIYNTNVSQIHLDETSRLWTAITHGRTISAKNMVIANSNNAKDFEQLKHLPSKPIRGQVTKIRSGDLKSTKTILCGEGYLCPASGGWHSFGATFDLDSNTPETTLSDQNENISTLRKWLPNWLDNSAVDEAVATDSVLNKAGLRCTTPDYIPIVGPAPDYKAMLTTFSGLRVGANSCNKEFGHYLPNLYVNVGHGSKGLYTTPISAELIKSYICAGAMPVSEEQRIMLSPARFIIKHLKQRRI
mgnify:CR=1 FL=1